MTLVIRDAGSCRHDLVALGEVMLRLDPGEGRVATTRSFQVWEGGGEYNVARAMRKCWGKTATHVTALPKNDLGWLVEDHMMQGGVDASHMIWREFDGIGRNVLDLGIFGPAGEPDVVLGQHLVPGPAGWVLTRPGVIMAATDALRITLHGRGGHGSRPETTVDPAVLASGQVQLADAAELHLETGGLHEALYALHEQQLDQARRGGFTGLAMTGPFSRKIILGLCTLFAGPYPIGRDDHVRVRSNADWGRFLARIFADVPPPRRS